MDGGPEATLKAYGPMLRRGWLLVAVGLLAGLGLGYVAMGLAPVRYTATTSVIVRPTALDTTTANGRTSGPVNLDTEAQLVTSSQVSNIAAVQLGGGQSAAELAQQVTVKVPANTSVLDISFEASSPSQAVTGAQAFAHAYLQNRTELARSDLNTQIQALEQQLATLRTQLRQVNHDLVNTDPGAKRDLLIVNKDLLVGQVRTITDQLNPLYTETIDPGGIITTAQMPTSPSGLNGTLLLLGGAVLGLLFGLVGAALRERADDRIRVPEDLSRHELLLLSKKIRLAHGAAVSRPGRPTSEPTRQLRNALLALLPERLGVVTVAATSSGDAGALTAANLATALATSGVRTILVGANTRSHALEKAFELPTAPGLAEALRSEQPVSQILRPVPGFDDLLVLPRGDSLSSRLLESGRLDGVLEEVGEEADVVLLDVAPTSANADAQTVVTHTDGLLLVATSGVSRSRHVEESLRQLTQVNLTPMGVVLVSRLPGRVRRLLTWLIKLAVSRLSMWVTPASSPTKPEETAQDATGEPVEDQASAEGEDPEDPDDAAGTAPADGQDEDVPDAPLRKAFSA